MNVQQFHTTIDRLLELAVKKLPPEAQPCCSRCTTPHCCSEPAYCDDHEIDAMLGGLTQAQRTQVAVNTMRWIPKSLPFIKQERPNAFPYRLANIPCPFLGQDGRCMAYENRPMDCRMFIALGDPKDCAMPARIKQKYAEYGPLPNAFFEVQQAYMADNLPLEMDHIGAHLARKVLGLRSFTTVDHTLVEAAEETKIV